MTFGYFNNNKWQRKKEKENKGKDSPYMNKRENYRSNRLRETEIFILDESLDRD